MYTAFFGHSDITESSELRQLLDQTIEQHICSLRTTEFLTGGMGNFDAIAENAVIRAKKQHPEIKLILVIPYLTAKLEKQKEYYEQRYDMVLYPNELRGVHPKGAITKRNRWMVDSSENIICCIKRNIGGAWTAVNYAGKKGKNVTNLASGNIVTIDFPAFDGIYQGKGVSYASD